MSAESIFAHSLIPQVNTALKRVQTILDVTRNPRIASTINHKYDDKYLLAELLTNTALAAVFNAFETIGLSRADLAGLRTWSSDRSVTLRLSCEESCEFMREEKRRQESAKSHETVVKTGTFKTEVSHKVVTTITEYFWKYTISYTLFAYKGSNPTTDPTTLLTRKGVAEIITTDKNMPHPAVRVNDPISLNITLLLQYLSPENGNSLVPRFRIDRESKECRTPRNNPQIDAILRSMRDMVQWASQVNWYFRSDVFDKDPSNTKYNMSTITDDTQIFIPVLPIFDETTTASNSSSIVSDNGSNKVLLVQLGDAPVPSESPLIAWPDVNRFLDEQVKSLKDKCREFDKTFPSKDGVICAPTAYLVLVAQHLESLADRYASCVDFIEDMLRTQLVSAIGKTLVEKDFEDYMRFHVHKIFRDKFRPKALCFPVRRPNHFPEGYVGLQDSKSPLTQLLSIQRHFEAPQPPISFAINAATKIQIGGERFLHGVLLHEFGNRSIVRPELSARATQFSSFILVVGTILSASQFEAKHAIIIQNKDDLKIPLLFEKVPTAREFKDAIASMSPEQQRFCKAYRAMQLESSLCGVCIIQIKPQVEKLLKLPAGSLTKEIRLTQDILKLLITYQIPSDMMTFDGPTTASPLQKIEAVKSYVATMMEMIHLKQGSELKSQLERFVAASGSGELMQIYVKTLTGKTLTLRVSSNDPVRRICEQIEDSEGIPISQQRIVFAGKLLDKTAPTPISKLSIVHESTLHLVLRLRGGGDEEPPAPAPSEGSAASSTSSPTPTATQSNSMTAEGAKATVVPAGFDFTAIPTKLDRLCEELIDDNSLRATIISIGEFWERKSLPALLTDPKLERLNKDDQKSEKNAAFDLLDAMTRSGILTIDDATLHVIVATTHSFDNGLIDTIVHDNINPIEKVERSLLVLAASIFDNIPSSMLLKTNEVQRVRTFSAPFLLAHDS